MILTDNELSILSNHHRQMMDWSQREIEYREVLVEVREFLHGIDDEVALMLEAKVKRMLGGKGCPLCEEK